MKKSSEKLPKLILVCSDEGEYLFFVVFLVHHYHDLGHSHINGFVVAIFIKFLKFMAGAQGIEGGW